MLAALPFPSSAARKVMSAETEPREVNPLHPVVAGRDADRAPGCRDVVGAIERLARRRLRARVRVRAAGCHEHARRPRRRRRQRRQRLRRRRLRTGVGRGAHGRRLGGVVAGRVIGVDRERIRRPARKTGNGRAGRAGRARTRTVTVEAIAGHADVVSC